MIISLFFFMINDRDGEINNDINIFLIMFLSFINIKYVWLFLFLLVAINVKIK